VLNSSKGKDRRLQVLVVYSGISWLYFGLYN
jgi:hypothetical protein